MNLTLTKMCQRARHGLVLVGLFAGVAGGSAHAGNVGISVGIHVPAAPVYVVPAPPPPPRVHYYHPAPPLVAYYPAPIAHGYWAPPPPPPRGYGKPFKHRGPKHYHRHHRH